MAYQELFSQNFSRGLVTVKPEHLLEEGESPRTDNVDFSRKVGRVTKRRGHSLLYTANVSSIPVTGLFEFVLADGTTKVLASSNDDVYLLTGSGTWTSIHNNASLNGAAVNFTTYNDLCIFVSLNLTTQKYTGTGSSSNLGGTPPSNAKYITSHRNRVWIANTSAGKSRLHYSALDNPEDWTTSGDAGFLDIGKADGEQITGIVSVGSRLVIFKQNSTWVVKNGTPSTFVVEKISSSVGCVAPRTIVAGEKFALFLSNDGVYAANESGVALMSYNIQPDFDSMSNATKSLACAGKLRTQYWLCVDTDSDSVNDTAYVLDYVYGIWSKYTNKKENVFYRRQDGTLISGGQDTDVIRKHDDTMNDNGSAITMVYDTPGLQFGSFLKNKQLHNINVETNTITGKTLVVSHIVDGVTQATTLTLAMDSVGTKDRAILRRRHPPSGSYGRTIRLRFTNSETSADVEIYSWRAGVQERENEDG